MLGTVTGVHPASRYGEMHVDGNVVTEFNEKPTLATGWVSGGFFAFNRLMIDKYLDDDADLLLEKKPLQTLAVRRRARASSTTRASGWAWTRSATGPS